MTGQQMTNLLPFLIFMLLTLIFDTGTQFVCPRSTVVIGYGNRGGKPKFKQRQKLKTKQYRATDLRSVALCKCEQR